MLKNRGATAMIEYNDYKTAPHRAGWALPSTFFYIHVHTFFQKNLHTPKLSILRNSKFKIMWRAAERRNS
jgi:adenosylcobinamide amidohydrolase